MNKYAIGVLELACHRHRKISEIIDANKNVAMSELAKNQIMNIHTKLQNNRCTM